MKMKPTIAGIQEEVRLMQLDAIERGDRGLSISQWVAARMKAAADRALRRPQ